MPTVVAEQFGRTLSGERGELLFIITGTEDPDEARDAMLADDDAVAELGDLERDDRGSNVQEYEGNSGGAYLGRVRYKRPDKPSLPSFETNDSVYNFEITGVPTRVQQSKETMASYGTEPEDFKGAINVQDGRVEGVDIIVPESTFSETHWIDDSTMTAAYQRTIQNIVGTVNDASFKGRAAGEVLFLGASGTKRGSDDWEVTFKFAYSPNVTNLSVGDLTVSSKAGWNYLWVYYEQVKETETGGGVTQPKWAYVERVYNTSSFGSLGIGT